MQQQQQQQQQQRRALPSPSEYEHGHAPSVDARYPPVQHRPFNHGIRHTPPFAQQRYAVGPSPPVYQQHTAPHHKILPPPPPHQSRSSPDLAGASRSEPLLSPPAPGANQPASTSLASASPTQAAQVPPKVSCLECRSSKVKCLPVATDDAPGSRCARCTRLDKECVYEKHKRGRKPDSVKYGKLEKQLESILQELRGEREARGSSDEGDREDGEPAAKRIRAETAEILTNWSASVHGGASSASATSSAAVSSRTAAAELLRALEERRTGPKSSKEVAPVGRRKKDSDASLTGDSGLPPLSNPLKLLAQASAGDDDDYENGQSGDASAVGSAAATPRRLNATQAPDRRDSVPDIGPRSHGRVRNELGIYDPKPEVGPKLDPIDVGLISLDGAKQLWEVFLEKLSHPLMLLDRKLYTFDYCRPRSSMLLSVGLALTARFIPATPDLPTDEIAEAIDKHVLEVIIPTVLLEGKRSVHCCKAFLLLAAYNGQCIPLSEDRSFSYVSWAFSMCVELDINRKMVSNEADPEDEILQRQLRDRERTFFTAWAYSFSLALHHGRRCSLAIHDPVVAGANEWHRNKFAMPEDAGLVSNLQLRKLIARNLDYYLQHVAPLMPKSPEDGAPDEACRLLLEFHLKSITDDLDAWHAAWVLPEAAATRTYDSSQTQQQQRARPLRLQSTAFYHMYATLILHSLPLRPGAEGDAVLKPFRRKADEAAVSCVALFLRLSQDQIIWGHNSPFVTVGFAAVYALRAPQPGMSVVEMVKQVVARMEVAGNVTPHRKSFATGYAVFLRKLVRIHEMRTAKQQQQLQQQEREQQQQDPSERLSAHQGVQQRETSSDGKGAYDNTSKWAAPSQQAALATYQPGRGGLASSASSGFNGHTGGAFAASAPAGVPEGLLASDGHERLHSTGLAGNSGSVAIPHAVDPLDNDAAMYRQAGGGVATTLPSAVPGMTVPMKDSSSWPYNGSEPPPSQAALMDDLVMTQPLGLQLHSLLDLDSFGWDWPLFPHNGGPSADLNSNAAPPSTSVADGHGQSHGSDGGSVTANPYERSQRPQLFSSQTQ